MEKLNELIGAHVQESIEIHSPEGELLERPLLGLLNLDFGSVRLQNQKQTTALSTKTLTRKKPTLRCSIRQ
jgi:hypothetical protein